MTLRALVMVSAVIFSSLATSSRATASSQDVVLEWNQIAVTTMLTPPGPATPFGQARFAAIVQLAVFEAVNAITHDYQPYLGTITAPAGASAQAAAVAAAHRVLRTYFSTNSAATLDAARVSSLSAIPDSQAKTDGIATGEAAATAMITLRANDGSFPLATHLPGAAAPGVWQATAGCAATGGAGAFFNWQNVTPFGIPSAAAFILDAPPSLTSERYAKDYLEVMTVGGGTSNPARPQDRSDVARIYRDTSPTNLLNSAARQVAGAQGRSLSENARALALLNMATNDSLVASFATKYSYNFWRPETAIHAGDTDGNPKTVGGSFAPYITTPCFPSYPSNHASGTGGGAEVLRRMYGAGGHTIAISSPNPVDAGIVLHYTTFKAITNDVDDARVYGGIHFRFDQEAGGRLGRDIATYVVKNNLQPIHGHD